MSSTENESSFRENINNSEHHDIHIDCLGGEITIDEVMKMLSSVAKNKSCDLTGNVADFFIVAKFLLHLIWWIYLTTCIFITLVCIRYLGLKVLLCQFIKRR